MNKEIEAHNQRAAAFQAHIDKYNNPARAMQTGISDAGHIEYKLDMLTEKVDKLISLMQELFVRSETDENK